MNAPNRCEKTYRDDPVLSPFGHTPMIAAGLDLGGTKIEAQIFDGAWSVAAKRRVDTPDTYPELLRAIADLIAWTRDQTGNDIPVGIGAAGLIDPASGRALTVNMCATGQTLPADINDTAGRPITYLNDCRALALSETVFGAGKGYHTVACVILGTGVGGGVTQGGNLQKGPTMTGGEFGHCAAPAAIIAQYDLPLVTCGCGRVGCIETYISGPGLVRLAKAMTGNTMTPRQITYARFTTCGSVWEAWCALVADMMRNLILTLDPDVIILGGGLSNIDGLTDDLTMATEAAQIGVFPIPPIVLAAGGDTSGARGAAFAAWMAQQ